MVTQSLLPPILIEFACAALVAILAFVDVVVGVVVFGCGGGGGRVVHFGLFVVLCIRIFVVGGVVDDSVICATITIIVELALLWILVVVLAMKV